MLLASFTMSPAGREASCNAQAGISRPPGQHRATPNPSALPLHRIDPLGTNAFALACLERILCSDVLLLPRPLPSTLVFMPQAHGAFTRLAAERAAVDDALVLRALSQEAKAQRAQARAPGPAQSPTSPRARQPSGGYLRLGSGTHDPASGEPAPSPSQREGPVSALPKPRWRAPGKPLSNAPSQPSNCALR